jgi:ribosomal peptide maturation radical SAM protein 1
MQAQGSTTHITTPTDALRVALVCMPFAKAILPSIQIGLLTAISEQAGFSTDAYHLNLELAARLTSEAYEPLCDHRGHMTGEWLFSVAAFGEHAHSDDEAYFAAFPEEIAWAEKLGMDTAYFSRLRHELLPRYIEDSLEMVDWERYQVVGFSSTFQQNVACLALARRIKERYPAVQILFGGANFEGEMGLEYVRAFPFIDYAIVGEGDIAFPALLRCLAAQEQPKDLPGLVMRTGEGMTFSGQAPPVRNLDALPAPNYDEYFTRAKRLGLKHHRTIPFESARGCWWGQKHHCTFCGLNGLGMTYRAKSPGRVLAELSELARKHRISFFEAVDNILDLKYVKDLFSRIAETKTDYQFFYEVKANLTHEQIRTLYRGGVRLLQPGIESLSSHVLQLMRKGCTMLQNVRTLKWCRYYNINVGWNLIWGFPGETEEDYRQELEVLQLITHLQPPRGCSRIWLERFAPYFSDRELFPIHDIRPEASYGYVYPAQVALEKVAYFFDYQMGQTAPAEAHAETCALVKEWQRRWEEKTPDTLVYRRTLDALLIEENRGPGRRFSYVFDGPWALMYEYCGETMRTIANVVEYLQTALGWPRFNAEDVRAALEEFCRLGLMLSEEGKYLSLALPVNPNW